MIVGDKFIVAHDFDRVSSISEYTVVKITSETVSGGKDLIFYRANCWPIEYRAKLEAIIAIRAELKAKFDDSMKLIYELRNEITRAGK